MAGKKGWHINNNGAPHRGKGSATVQPIRKRKDIAAIKQSLAEQPRDLALFTLGINTGLRAGDLLKLKYKDILTPEDNIKSALEIVEIKTDKHRRIRLGPKPRRVLLALLPEYKDDYDPEAYIFPSRKGGRMSVQRLHQLVNQWCEDAGVKGHFGTHTLRKTYGYFHYDRGTDIALLMRAFGHSSQSITLRYIGIEQKQIDEANLRLDL